MSKKILTAEIREIKRVLQLDYTMAIKLYDTEGFNDLFSFCKEIFGPRKYMIRSVLKNAVFPDLGGQTILSYLDEYTDKKEACLNVKGFLTRVFFTRV